MKSKSLCSFLIALFLFTACPPVKVKNEGKIRLEKNNMDFDSFENYYFEGVNYKLWDVFKPEFYREYTLSDVSERFSVENLNLYFSIEKFSLEQAQDILFSFNEDIDLVDAVHQNYMNHRIDYSYEDIKISSKTAIPDSIGVNGFIQVIEDGEKLPRNESYGSTYFIATFKKKNQYYVIQLIGPISNMGYLYDDFIDLVKSVS